MGRGAVDIMKKLLGGSILAVIVISSLAATGHDQGNKQSLLPISQLHTYISVCLIDNLVSSVYIA